MKIQFNNLYKKEGYIIPLSIIMYLNETYEDKDISFKVLHYFLCYLYDVKKNKLLESYKNDKNEIKIALNGLSNKILEFNSKLNDYLVDEFCEFIKIKEDHVNLLIENIEDIPENIDSIFVYEKFCSELLEQKEIERSNSELVELNIEYDPDEKQIENLSTELEEDVNIKRLFAKFFEDKPLSEKISKGSPPEYEWNQTSLRFKNPDGTWGKWVDLKGSSGKSGGGSKGMNREQVNELIQDALALEESSTVSNVFPFFMS